MNINDQSDLDATIERLYTAFNKYPTWSQDSGCPCCHEPALQALLRTKKLRDLTHADLYEFGCSATLTWGSVDDFRHFLPRLFELSVESDKSTWDTYLVLNRLGSVDWQDWPADEKDAIAATGNSLLSAEGTGSLYCSTKNDTSPDEECVHPSSFA